MEKLCLIMSVQAGLGTAGKWSFLSLLFKASRVASQGGFLPSRQRSFCHEAKVARLTTASLLVLYTNIAVKCTQAAVQDCYHSPV